MMRKNSTKFNEKEIVVSKTRTRPMRTRTRVLAASTTPYYAYDNHGRKARKKKKKKKKKSRRNSETTSSLSSLDFPLSSWCASTTSELGSGFKECEQLENNNVETLSKFVDCDKQASLFDTEKLKPTQMNGLDCTSMKSTAEFKPTTIPSKHELEEFFSSAEKQLHDQFSNKYNFDVVKDVPLEGRYEWVQIKP